MDPNATPTTPEETPAPAETPAPSLTAEYKALANRQETLFAQLGERRAAIFREADDICLIIGPVTRDELGKHTLRRRRTKKGKPPRRTPASKPEGQA